MIVEFCGLPGCGKSTILDKISSGNNLNYVSRSDLRNDRSFGYKMYCKYVERFYPNWLLNQKERLLIAFINDYSNVNHIYGLRLLKMHYLLKKHKNDILILDEGAVQYLSSIPFSDELCCNDHYYSAIQNMTKHVDLIFKCECSYELAYTRIIQRNRVGGDRYLDKPKEEILNLLKVKQKNIDTILNDVSVQVIKLDMSQDFCSIEKRIMDSLISIKVIGKTDE